MCIRDSANTKLLDDIGRTPLVNSIVSPSEPKFISVCISTSNTFSIFMVLPSASINSSIILKSLVTETDFLTKEGLQWLSDNMFTDTIEMKIGKKDFSEDRNSAIFQLIQQGAFLSGGELFKQINEIIEG